MSTLTFMQARDEMLAFFLAAWNPAYPVTYDDVNAEPPSTQTVWARAIVKHATGFQSSLRGPDGCKRHTQGGVIFFQIFAPVGNGIVSAYNAAQTVSDAYTTAILFQALQKYKRIY